MTEIKETAGNDAENQEAVSIETAKVIQGMSMVFCGALTMLEALHPHVSLAPSAILDLVTGNVSGLEEIAAQRCAEADKTLETTENQKETGAGKEDGEDVSETAGSSDAVPDAHSDGDAAHMDADASAGIESKPEPSVTVDEVAKIVVQKVKANPGINEKVRALVNAHGAQRVTELKPEVLEAFLTDLAQL